MVKKKNTDEVEEEITTEDLQEESAEAEEADAPEAVDEAAEAAEDASEEETEEETDEPGGTAQLEKEIESLKTLVESQEDKYLKLLAEFENFKRRNRQEAELRNKYKEQALAEDLLSVIDNLERALQVEEDNEAFSSLKKGVDMVYKDFIRVFESHDIKPIESVGAEFDPNVHQAVMTEKDDNVEPNIVIEEFQKGYLLKDRVIRPSMVKVSE